MAKEEAIEETLQMIDIYAEFAEKFMAMPVLVGAKSEGERFPGAVDTYSIEAMMQDGKALQAGTSHFLGQHFSKASEIKFLFLISFSKTFNNSKFFTFKFIGSILWILLFIRLLDLLSTLLFLANK